MTPASRYAASTDPALRYITHSDGAYTVLMLGCACAAPVDTLAVHYTLLAELDPQHCGLLALRHANAPWGAGAA